MGENQARLSEARTRCPFWSSGRGNECGLDTGGMFIPMPEHVSMFCLSSNYTMCRQYIRGCEQMLARDAENRADEYAGQTDRRRQQRFPEQLQLDIVVCDNEGPPRILQACKAKSLDVSLGGLRIESFRNFPIDTVLSFVLDPDFSTDSLLGVGKVVWCRPANTANKYEAGVEFANYSSSESMREYLNLSQA